VISKVKEKKEEEQTGPMMVAMNELKKRLLKDIDFV
jgi:hypothetical protein